MKDAAHVAQTAKAAGAGDLFGREVRLDQQSLAPRQPRLLDLLTNGAFQHVLEADFQTAAGNVGFGDDVAYGDGLRGSDRE